MTTEKRVKRYRSKYYNYDFYLSNGLFYRWGKTIEDDPLFSPVGPEIADIEIVQGKCKGMCDFCYKSNGEVENHYMPLEKFKTLLSKLPDNLMQIAFGITDIDGNPDFFKIMEYTRSKGIIPNYTTHGLDITEDIAKKTSELCGAVAVSIVNKNKTYDSIKMFTDAGMDQVNIHFTLSKETYYKAFEILKDITEDNRLSKLNAIVFLSLKQKGRGHNHSRLSFDKYRKLVDYAMKNNINIGFDSCSAPLFLAAMKDHDNFKEYEKLSESCEAYLFSIYINTFGECTPCSFLEDEGYDSFNVLECDDFMKDIWNHHSVSKWRDTLLKTASKCSIADCRMCPHYNLYPEELYK